MSLTSNRSVFDFTDTTPFAVDVPHDALTVLRRTRPVYWNPGASTGSGSQGFWLITKHRDIVHVEKNPQLFSSHYGLTLEDSPSEPDGPPLTMIRDGLTHLDPPEHALHRQTVAPCFSPKAIAAREPRIRAMAEEVIDRACGLGAIDFATDVALRFPVAVVLGEILGIPEQDFARVVRWSDVIVAPRDPEFPPSAGAEVLDEMYEYAVETARARRCSPGPDVLSVLAHTKMANGELMSTEVFVRFFWSIVTGAFDTTASLIAGGMLAFIRFPDQYARVVANPELVSLAVEEMLRWETPTIYFRRTAVSDTEIRGQKIRRGQFVVMCYASANRDEDVFVNPFTFDVAREPNDHLSFGHGPHHCLGAGLARTETRILFDVMARARIRVTERGSIRRAQSNFQNRIKCMPVTFVAGR